MAPIWRVAARAKHRRGSRSCPSPLQVTTPGPGLATRSPRHAGNRVRERTCILEEGHRPACPARSRGLLATGDAPNHAMGTRTKKAPGKTVSQGGGGHASFPGAIGRSVPSWPTQGQPDGSTECFRSAPHASMPADKRFAVRRDRAIARSPDADPSTWIVASSIGEHAQTAACRLAPPKGTITFAAGNPGRCCRGLMPAASGMPCPASVCHPHDVCEIIRFAQRRQGRFLGV